MVDREALRARLLATFKGEAREHVGVLAGTLLELEKLGPGESSAQLIEVAFRVAHSLKGAARSVSLSHIEAVCQGMESVFSSLKRGAVEATPARVDVLLQSVRALESLLAAVEAGTTHLAVQIAPLVSALEAAAKADAPAPIAPGAPALGALASPALAAPALPAAPAVVREELDRAAAETVRVPTEKLDQVRRQAEELLGEKLAVEQHAIELGRLRTTLGVVRKQWARRVREFGAEGPAASARARAAPRGEGRWKEFQDWSELRLDEIEHRVAALARSALRNQRSLAAKADAVLDESRHLLMLPCSWMLQGFEHLVRDLARDQGKQIQLRTAGEGIEIDRRILTELKDPFVHILRNAIAHGVETPAERVAAGKPARAAIAIAIAQTTGNHVEIAISDDGRGVDVDKVRAAAARLGLAQPADGQGEDREAMLNLVFSSALSTSAAITEISGRGLGLAIVREKVEKLGGTVAVTSEPGRGTTLRIEVPSSLATLRGVVVRLDDRFFVVPTSNVERAIRVRADQIRTLENQEAVEVQGRPVALVHLARLLGLPSAAGKPRGAEPLAVLMVASAGVRIGFAVDEVCFEQDVLMRPLGPQLADLPGVLGATVLGDGKIAPVLDARHLVGSAVERGAEPRGAAVEQADEPRRRHSVLVAEDSITSRTLLKTILESAGFFVVTAIDGVDALTKLRSGEFDLVVSDVDMPRLDGLGLTAKIRQDKKLGDIPVVLVTSLESRADRERGIEVGASAYIVKQSFEQSDLLEVIRRLL